MLLAGKIVVVSGIGPGLGRELALAAAQEGAQLAVCARTQAKLEEVQERIAELGLGTRTISRSTDIRDRDQVRAFVQTTLDSFGRIDVVINSAYVTGQYTMAAEADLDDWRQTMNINLFGTMTMIQEVVPTMRAQGGGSIVNVNTKIARMPQDTLGGYAVSKAALRMATTQLAKELGRDRIRVNSIFPGWMWGETVKAGLQAVADSQGRSLDDVKEEIVQRLPLGEMPTDAQCARAVVALASDHFLPVTGACLDLSSGEYLPV